MKIYTRFTLLFFSLISTVSSYAYEQDNWYLHGPIDGNLTGVFHQEYDSVNKRDLLYKNASGVGLEVRDINGTLIEVMNTGGTTFTDIEFNQTTSRLFGINGSRLTCFEQNATYDWEEQWRSTQAVTTMAQAPNGKLYCANNGNKIYVFEQNGTMSSEFGYVDGINSLYSQTNVVGFAPGGMLVVWGRHRVTGGSDTTRFFCFDESANFIKTNSIYTSNSWYSGAQVNAKIHTSGLIFRQYKRDYNFSWVGQAFYNPVSVTPTYSGIAVSLWLQNGDFISGSNLYRRTFRTKMETYHNSVPEPVIHRIAQRTGTNILELDFEVIDTDDDNVTVGILAYCGSDVLVPQAWVNGTGSKIGTPIATNTVHSMEWDVKQDWNTSTGDIKFEILCQDGSRDKPVDLHFLNLPFEDGNMTISRSPLRDSDFVNYFKYLLATNVPFAIDEGNATNIFEFTNAGVTGRMGPTKAQVDANYSGTNLEGDINMTDQGIQEWTVPTTGTYTIAAYGAQGGSGNYYRGGLGAGMRGEFQLNAGQVLKILVGQQGGNHSNNSGGGGGGTFVVKSDNTPLIIAGGGSGGGGNSYARHGQSGLSGTSGGSGSYNNQYAGGTNGSGGESGTGSGGGGGLIGNGSTGYQNTHGISFTNGGNGGTAPSSGGFGGFGGGGAGEYSNRGAAGAGGGYSGGGGTGGNGVSGGGGSYNSGSNQLNFGGKNEGHGRVLISLGAVSFDVQPTPTMNSDWVTPTDFGRDYFNYRLGLGYRFATPEEVTKAREAATPGGVNNWTATNQVKTRNLPGKINEYGFDVSTTSGYWVIKE